MEEQLRALLLASSGVTALAGSRVNWGEHPQGSGSPYIVLELISSREDHTMQGPDGLMQARVQVDAYAPTFRQAMEIGRAVKGALVFYRDDSFRGILFDSRRMMRESVEAGGPIHRCSQDFIVNWRESNG